MSDAPPESHFDLLAPIPGFRFAGVHCGLKKKEGALDLGVVIADEPAVSAAVLTRNLVRAAPVEVVAERIKRGKTRALLVNSGNANACTGAPGMRATLETSAALAAALDCPPEQVLPASKGVIGVLLPAEKVNGAIAQLVAAARPEGVADFAEAIRTTDRFRKVARRKVRAGKKRSYSVLAVAKGAGMIHPDMATTLAFVFTDAPVKRSFLKSALKSAIDASFNRITVDGDTSTNDTVAVLASGAGGGPKLAGECSTSRRFVEALHGTLTEVAKMIVADGEGAEHIARIEVRGAATDTDATKIARTIATSPLVKTALHGKDPNWGRILAAAGRAGASFDPAKATLDIGGVRVFERGKPIMDAACEARASAAMEAAELYIVLRVREGKGRGWYWTSDLGHAYVTLNADYRS